MNSKLAAAIAVASALCACDGQVDSGYRGEPLMVLRGSVVSSETPLSGELIPTFAFIHQESKRPPPESADRHGSWVDHTWHFLRGDVEGSFPNAFTLTLYDPPPKQVLRSHFAGEPAWAIGAVGAISPEHPNSLAHKSIYPPLGPTGEPLADLSSQICADDGQCLESADQCVLGRPLPDADWPCGPKFPDELPWETYGSSEHHLILYLAEAAAAGTYTARKFAEGAAIAAGYHLITMSPPRSEWKPQEWSEESQLCMRERSQRIHAEFTAKLPPTSMEEQGFDEADLPLYEEIMEREELDHPCENDPKTVLADTDEPIELTLSALPSDGISF
jgi:hypothetical protein